MELAQRGSLSPGSALPADHLATRLSRWTGAGLRPARAPGVPRALPSWGCSGQGSASMERSSPWQLPRPPSSSCRALVVMEMSDPGILGSWGAAAGEEASCIRHVLHWLSPCCGLGLTWGRPLYLIVRKSRWGGRGPAPPPHPRPLPVLGPLTEDAQVAGAPERAGTHPRSHTDELRPPGPEPLAPGSAQVL